MLLLSTSCLVKSPRPYFLHGTLSEENGLELGRCVLSVSWDEESIPLFQNFARDPPPCRDDVCAFPPVVTPWRGPSPRARDRGEPRDDPLLVEPFWPDLCRRDPQEADGSNACVVGLTVAPRSGVRGRSMVRLCKRAKGKVCRASFTNASIHRHAIRGQGGAGGIS